MHPFKERTHIVSSPPLISKSPPLAHDSAFTQLDVRFSTDERVLWIEASWTHPVCPWCSSPSTFTLSKGRCIAEERMRRFLRANDGGDEIAVNGNDELKPTRRSVTAVDSMINYQVTQCTIQSLYTARSVRIGEYEVCTMAK